MKTYKVIRFNPGSSEPDYAGAPIYTHTCIVSEPGKPSREEHIDLMINGDFPKDTDPKSLVGRTFTADYDYAYVSIAVRVREVAP